MNKQEKNITEDYLLNTTKPFTVYYGFHKIRVIDIENGFVIGKQYQQIDNNFSGYIFETISWYIKNCSLDEK